jgi:23S rRNA (pseudouridine1915-N3)-methyltransferase
MLNVKLICVGKMRERFFIDAFEEYRKRLGAFCRLELSEPTELRLPEKPSPAEIETALEREAREIEKQIPPDAYVVALCVEGKEIPSEGMAELILQRENSGKPKLCFVIGGSFGLSDCIKERANFKLSMSKMTFLHEFARLILVEQIYRAFKIIKGEKCHK